MVQSVEVNEQHFVFLRVFQLLGFAPIAFHLQGSKALNFNKTLHMLAFVGVMIFGLVIGGHMIQENDASSFYSYEKVGATIDLINLIALLSSFMSINIEAFAKKEYLMRFLQTLNQLDQYKDEDERKRYRKAHQKLLSCWVLVCLTICFYAMYVYCVFQLSVVFNVGFVVTHVMSYSRYLQIVGFIQIIGLELDILKNKAFEISKDKYHQYYKEDLQTLIFIYGLIFQLYESFQGMTTWSVRMLFLANYVRLTMSVYWIYWELYVLMDYSEILYVVLSAFIQFLFVNRAQAVECRKKFLQQTVLQLGNVVEDLKMANKLHALSLQMKHQNIIIDANGVFPFNHKIFKTNLETITTYYLFYVQFNEKLKIVFDMKPNN